MNNTFILSCESTTDIPFSVYKNRNIPVIFYKYTIDDEVHFDNMSRDISEHINFYDAIKKGKLPKTSQINQFEYGEYFEGLLTENLPILHIGLSSGITPSVNNAKMAAKEINERLGEDRILVIDSLAASSGFGLLMELAINEKEKGKSREEVAEYVSNIKNNIQHIFYSSDMQFFRRSGRVTGVAATVAGVLGICPIMHLDAKGKMIAYNKVRGKKNATEKLLSEMKELCEDGINYDNYCYISHSNCHSDATLLAESIEKTFPNLKGKVKIFDIGNIIGSHCGPGTVSLYFVGNQRV